MYYVYVLRSKKDNGIYVGSTNNLKRRLKEHNDGKEFYTKNKIPWELVYYESYNIEYLARMREKRLKNNGNSMRELKKRIFEEEKSGKGYTLIELMIVTFIIVVVTTIPLFNYREGSKELALARSAFAVAQGVRKAEELAISAKEFQGQVPAGYGIYFNSSTYPSNYIIFADVNGDKEYSGFYELVENAELENGIKIGALNPQFNQSLSIVFISPDPTVVFTPDGSTVNITIEAEGMEKPVTQYTYEWTSLLDWNNDYEDERADCDVSDTSACIWIWEPLDCPRYFSAKEADPVRVYDRCQYCYSGPWGCVDYAVRFQKKQSEVMQPPQRTISVNKAGLVEIE